MNHTFNNNMRMHHITVIDNPIINFVIRYDKQNE